MYVAVYMELMSATNWVNFDDNDEFNDCDGDGGLWKKWAIYGGVSTEQDSVAHFRKRD
jgi:hypothetical protein